MVHLSIWEKLGILKEKEKQKKQAEGAALEEIRGLVDNFKKNRIAILEAGLERDKSPAGQRFLIRSFIQKYLVFLGEIHHLAEKKIPLLIEKRRTGTAYLFTTENLQAEEVYWQDEIGALSHKAVFPVGSFKEKTYGIIKRIKGDLERIKKGLNQYEARKKAEREAAA